MIKIYGQQTPMSFKVLWAAEELGLPYEHVDVDLTKGEQKTPEHLRRHPFGKVPVIEHDGRCLFESNAIVRYLGNLRETKLYPSHPFDRATVDQWLDYMSFHAGRSLTVLWFHNHYAPNVLGRAPDPRTVADAEAALLAELPALDAHLQSQPYLAGFEPTLADVVGASLGAAWRQTGLDFTDFRAFQSWIQRMTARPAYRKLQALSPEN